MKFEFGWELIKWIEIISAHPVASVITNQDISNPFQQSCGMRQGCPLSPFLLAISMEPLAVSKDGRSQHVLLYADDIIL